MSQTTRAELPCPDGPASQVHDSPVGTQIQARYRVALANSGVVLFEQDTSLRYTWIDNPQFHDTSQVIGRTDAELFRAADAAPIAEIKQRVLRTGLRAKEEVSITMNGRRHVYVLTVDPVAGPGGEVVGLTGASRDVTASKEMEEGLGRALAFRDEVIGILGHDLRNPLNAIYMGARVLSSNGLVSADGEATARIIERSAKRMLEMIGTLLDFAEGRFQTRLPISPDLMNLGEIVQRVVDEVEAAHVGRKVDVDVAGDVQGRWDAGRLAQVASNLIVNAVKHGAPQCVLRARVRGEAQRVVLEVQNDGTPIPPDRLAGLFQPFQRGQVADSSANRGLGLGLYIAKQIVTAHEGTIDVESTEGTGTVFRVTLPRLPPPPVEAFGQTTAF